MIIGPTLGLAHRPPPPTFLLRAKEFNLAPWSMTDVTVTPDDAAAPDGTTTADLLTEGVAGNASASQSFTGVANATHSFSLGLNRSANADWYRLIILDLGVQTNRVSGWFNINAGTAGTATNGGTGSGATTTIQDWGGGWYRCILTGAVGNSATSLACLILSASADASNTRVNNAAAHAWNATLRTGIITV